MRYLMIMVFIGVFSSMAFAAEDFESRVSVLTQGQGRVERTFPGPEGVQGIVIGPAKGVQDQGKILAWGLPNGLIMIGNLYDRTGRNLSDVVHTEKKEWFGTASVDFWGAAERLVETRHAVAEGSGPNTVYVFTEASCTFCQKFFYEAHQDPEFLSRVRIVWIPVTRNGSDLRTGAILSGDLGILSDPSREATLTKDQEEAVLANTMFLKAGSSKVATPSFLLKVGNQGQFVSGLTKNDLSDALKTSQK